MIWKECVVCGECFLAGTPIRTYCSKSCRQKAHYRRNRLKRILKTRHYAQKAKDSCWFCESNDNLENHHVRYVDDLNEVIVACRSCHKKLHIIISKKVKLAEGTRQERGELTSPPPPMSDVEQPQFSEGEAVGSRARTS